MVTYTNMDKIVNIMVKNPKKDVKTITLPKQTGKMKHFGIKKYELNYNPTSGLATQEILDDVWAFMHKVRGEGHMARVSFHTKYEKKHHGKKHSVSNTYYSGEPSHDPQQEELKDGISRIQDSQQSFILSDAKIVVTTYNVPQGTGSKIPVPKWIKDKTKSVFLIDNDDNLCGQRCLVLGMVKSERKKYLRKKEELFKKEANKLAKEIGVLGAMSILDFEKFVIKYPKYRVSIVSDLNTILYETENIDYKEEIFIYYDKRIEHYHYINNIDGFFNDKNGHYKFCRQCRQRLEKRVYDKHKCKGLKCNLCQQTFNTEEEKVKHLKSPKSIYQCTNCNLKCRGDYCLERHQNGFGKRKGCKGPQWFFDCCLEEGYTVKECWGRKEDKPEHKCSHAYCKTCDEYEPRHHRCWIKPRENKDRGLVSLISFDFEAFVDDETGEHQVNYIVAKERGTNTPWEWFYDKDKDILKEFIDFVFTKPKTTFIAHNGKAYDTWLIHHYITKHYNERPTNIILAGTKIMYMEIKSVKFIDSLNHFQCRLEDVPGTFGLDEKQFKKGFYPYIFNTKKNWEYCGGIPDIKYFEPDAMKEKKRHEFLKWWYDKKKSNYIWCHKKETQEYCISDVDILLQGCNVYSQEGLDLVGIDPLEKKTIASWVMDLYLKNFYDFNKTPICVLYKEECDFIRSSFHGGRTETFRLYRKWSKEELLAGLHGEYQDVKSLYPTTQYYDPLPIGEPKWVEDFNGIDINNYINDNYGWYEVDISMNKNLFIPPLLSKSNGKLTADLIDKQKVVFHAVELREAIKSGCVITKVYKALLMYSSTELFKDFVSTFLEVKENASPMPEMTSTEYKKWVEAYEKEFNFTPNPSKEELGNPGKRAIAKMILLSLWGKFGQRPDMSKHIYIAPDKVSKWYKMLKDCNEGKISIKGEEISGDHLFVNYMDLDDNNNNVLKCTSIAIASSVTACATMRLYGQLKLLGKRALYCDTDSIIYEYDPNQYNIPEGYMLGDWGNETKGLPITEFASTGPKSYGYLTNGKVKECKMKGITLNWANSKEVNFKALKLLIDGDKNELITKQNLRFVKNKETGIKTVKMTKQVKFTLDKRAINGYWTYPFGYEGQAYNDIKVI
jgi:hypothetical protein